MMLPPQNQGLEETPDALSPRGSHGNFWILAGRNWVKLLRVQLKDYYYIIIHLDLIIGCPYARSRGRVGT